MINNYIVPFIELLASGDVSFMDVSIVQQVYERRKVAEYVMNYFEVVP